MWQIRSNGSLPCLKKNRWEKPISIENCHELQPQGKKNMLCLKIKLSSQFHVFSQRNFSEIDFESKLCHSCSFHFFIWKYVRSLHFHKQSTFSSNQFHGLSFPNVMVSIHLKTKSMPEMKIPKKDYFHIRI